MKLINITEIIRNFLVGNKQDFSFRQVDTVNFTIPKLSKQICIFIFHSEKTCAHIALIIERNIIRDCLVNT